VGEQAKREVKDVFDDLEVCRVKWTPRFWAKLPATHQHPE
jgi:hypothetical protein